MTVDTDVVVIALYAFWDLDLELWIESAEGKTVSGWQCMLTLKFLERRYATLYFSGMPPQAVVLCPSSLEKERKQHGKPGEDFWRQQKRLSDFRAYQISGIRHQDYREFCCPHVCFMSPCVITGSICSPS